MKKIFFCAIICILTFHVHAQLSIGGVPPSFTLQYKTVVPEIQMPIFDLQSELYADSIAQQQQKPLRFAKLFDTRISPHTDGVWHTQANGDRIWRVSIKSEGAYSIGIIMSRFNLPPDARLFIYNSDTSRILGAYTHDNNLPSGILAIQPLQGDGVVIEYFEPQIARGKGELEIGQVAHDYRNIFKALGAEKTSGSCNVDINCPDGDQWQNEKRAVVRMIIQGNTLCSGTLINNTANNALPYVITADHCYENGRLPETTVFYFNYEKSDCGSGSFSDKQTVSGASKLASGNGALDFFLLKMSQTPPQSFEPYYAGWNRSTTAANNGVCIHHPAGDVKKISKEDDALKTGSFGASYVTNSHWLVETWESGTTEGGSSGSSLFNKNHQIIGTLTGGDASCGNSVRDYFSKFDMAWSKFSSPSEQLKYWLDPNNTGTMSLNGLDPYKLTEQDDAKILSINEPKYQYCTDTLVQPSVMVFNNGNNAITSLKVQYQIDTQEVQTLNWTQTIGSFQTVEVKLPKAKFVKGEQNIVFSVSMPNGVPDNNPIGDQLSRKVRVVGSFYDSLILSLTTDQRGKETSYRITDEFDKTIYEANNFTSNTKHRHNFCLEDGNYKFIISDLAGNGICCTYGLGSYTFANISTNQIVANTDFIGSQLIFPFNITSTSKQTDAEILWTPKPAYTYCIQQSDTPRVYIRNKGNKPISSVQVSYSINGTKKETKTWTGNLAPRDTATIVYNPIMFDLGQNNFNAVIEQVNNQADTLYHNNVLKKTVTVGRGNGLKLEMITDQHANENRWEIRNNNDNELAYQGGYYTNETTTNEYFCIDYGYYTFRVFDQQNDGMCCAGGIGSFALVDTTVSATYAQGDMFKNIAEYPFYVYIKSVNDTYFNKQFKLYPNPTTNLVYIETASSHYEVSVWDIYGKLLLQKNDCRYKNSIELGSYTQGIYLIKISDAQHSEYYKIVKQ